MIPVPDYSAIIPLWPILSGREKFNALARYRRTAAAREKKAARLLASREARKSKKAAYDQARREKKQAAKKKEWNPPGGFYPMAEIIQRGDFAVSTIKRYIAKGEVRTYKACGRVVICEYDVIVAKEKGREQLRENGRMRKAR